MFYCDSTNKGWPNVPLCDAIYENTSKWVSQKGWNDVKMKFARILCSSTILIYAHQRYDDPVIDAVDYFWPSKIAKFVIKEKFTNFYTMELETTSEHETSEAPCNMDSEYSYSKEGTD